MDTRTILISGSSTGIGRDAALALAKLGFRVFAGIRKAADGHDLRTEGGENLVPIILDVTDRYSIADALAQVDAAVGQQGLYGLVNNAGIVVSGPLEFLKVEDLRRQFEVNVFGVMALTQAFLPLLRMAQGRIATVGSVSGIMSYPFVAPYCASKFAVRSLMDSLRLEIKPWNILVSLIEPGPVETPIWQKSLNAANEIATKFPAEAERLYGIALRTVEEAVQSQAKKEAVPVSHTTRAIVHALTAEKPKRRYLVGKSANLEAAIGRYMPEKLRDRLIMKGMGLS